MMRKVDENEREKEGGNERKQKREKEGQQWDGKWIKKESEKEENEGEVRMYGLETTRMLCYRIR